MLVLNVTFDLSVSEALLYVETTVLLPFFNQKQRGKA